MKGYVNESQIARAQEKVGVPLDVVLTMTVSEERDRETLRVVGVIALRQ